MKIRVRLTLWYFVVTFIILVAFGTGIFFNMERVLFGAIDEDLRIIVDSVQASYNPSSRTFDIINSDSEKVNPLLEYFLIIYDVSGRPIYKSPIARDVRLGVPLSDRHVQLGETLEITVQKSTRLLHPDFRGELTFRAINRKIFYRNRQIGWVTVALPIERSEKAMRQLFHVILVSILIAVLFISVSGYWLTRKALFPIDRIIKKANRISRNNLNERLEPGMSNDEIGALTATLNDLLDRLQRAFESQDTFLQDAAHELKTPLSVLRAHWEGELNNPDIPLEIKEKFARDVETISRLSHLINNLLLLSKTEDIRANFVFENVSLSQLLQNVANDAAMLAEMKQQQLLMDRIPSVLIRGDRTRLYQLFFNIIDNAIKYTQGQGVVRISATVDGGFAAVDIRDNGPGIPEEDMPHIFDRFYRVQKDRSRRTGGSGLGLAISKLIAEIHHGEISVESKLERGSVFTIRLPIIS